MNLLRKFRSLSRGERSLLLRTVLVVTFLRVALCLVPFVWLKEYMALRAVRNPIRQDIPVERVVWAVRTAAAYIPRATCLTQALAAKYQLERSGRSGRIHIGVDKKDGQFLAHAWLECEGETVIGGRIVHRYARLVAVD
jgi:transglutaminase superfamily protein